MGNQPGTFSEQLDQAGFITKNVVGTITGAPIGAVESALHGKIDFGQLTGDLSNVVTSVQGTNQEYIDTVNPPSSAELRRRQFVKQQDTLNKNTMGIGRLANSAYSGNMSSVTPPSQLMAISDPSAKMAIAGSMGKSRASLQHLGNQFDLGAHSSIATATGATAETPSSLEQTGTGADVSNGSNPPVETPP